MEPDTQNNQAPQPPEKSGKGYGKRPVWQWVLIYVIVAAVVYGLIYFLFLRDSGGNSGVGY